MKPWPYPRLTAHRGGGKLAPENTLAAIRLGHSLGFRSAEIDVRFSRDGVEVVQHDALLDRTTNGTGPLAERTWAELSSLDAGARHSEAFRGEPLARLSDAANLLQSLRMSVQVEIKRIPGLHRQCGERVARAVAKYWQGAVEAPLIISFSSEAVDAARVAEPALPRGWIVEEPWDGDLAPLARLDVVSLHLEHVLINPALVARVHGEGRRLLAWTVNDVARAEELLAMGVDGLVTDNLQEFATRFPELL
ncbi:MAG: glycerophosphodiester phosphodiesterase [Betaproteobacteria bacterium]|nr:glycerophosphodiester phosphodiesterase [Betaproteobacteria bacterium]